MKRVRIKMVLCLLSIVIITAFFPQQVMAAGTASTTLITNEATIKYTVDSLEQTPVVSNKIEFKVDNKVNLTIATQDNVAVPVTPGSAFSDGNYNILTFRVKNDGNTTQDYALSVVTVSKGVAANFSGNDAFDMDANPDVNARIFVNTEKGVDGSYELGDASNFIDELEADQYVDVFVVLDAPLTATNGQIASYHLVATTHDSGTAGTIGNLTQEDKLDSWDSANVQVVFADGAGTAGTTNDDSRDGKFSNQNDYVVSSAQLTVTKSQEVIFDPFNGTLNPKAIPGSIIRYTIEVKNGGSEIAKSVNFEDEIKTPTIFASGSITLNGSLVDDAAYDDNTKKVTVHIGDLDTSTPDDTAIITFNVTIP